MAVSTAAPILSNRALCLAKIETTYNVDAVPTPASNAFLVMNADIKLNPNVLRRDFYRPSLSPLGIFVGRKLVTLSFTHEVKGSGASATAPKLGTLLRACGFAQTTIAATAAAQISNPVGYYANTGPTVTWTKDTAPTQGWGRYRLKVVLGGASATAKVQVFGNPPDYTDETVLPKDEYSATIMGPGATTTVAVDTTDPLAVTYTVGTPQIGDVVVLTVGGLRFKHTVASGVAGTVATALAAAIADPASVDRYTAGVASATVTVTITGGVTTVTTATTDIPLGNSGALVNMTWTGNLVLNDYYTIDLLRPGFHYTPVSSGFESLTVYMYYDGILHRVTGCIGTVVFTAQAGQFATAAFTFTGQYHDPEDQPLPTNSVFEATAPQQVELAQLLIGGAKDICAQSYSIDMAVQVNPRDCVSGSDGYNGVLYTSRAPKGGANPEMTLESVEPYWRNMAVASYLEFHGRVGTTANNRVEFVSHSVQLTGVGYGDRNNQRVYDLGFEFVADTFTGDDEVRVHFS